MNMGESLKEVKILIKFIFTLFYRNIFSELFISNMIALSLQMEN